LQKVPPCGVVVKREHEVIPLKDDSFFAYKIQMSIVFLRKSTLTLVFFEYKMAS
jgi:hypothetical protein